MLNTKPKLLHKGGQLSKLLTGRLLESGLWCKRFQDSIIQNISKGIAQSYLLKHQACFNKYLFNTHYVPDTILKF